MKKIKVISILLACMFLLAACGSNNDLNSNTSDKETVQTDSQNVSNDKAASQPAENAPPKNWEPNPLSDFEYSYEDELQGVEVHYRGESETVWFPTEINGDPVVSIGQIRNPQVVKEVYIPEGIKVLAPGAFDGCQNLESVIIPEGVVEIGYAAFRDCKNLSSVVVPDSVTEIDGDAFYQCSSLTSFRFPSNLKVIGSRAFGKVPLSEIILPEGLEVIDYLAFMQCDEVTSIIIPSSVTTIGRCAFEYCEKLAEITLADPDALIDISYEVFEGSYWYNKQPDGFVILGNNLVAYKGEIAGTKLVIPDGIKTIAQMITDDPSMENVTEIVLPEGLKGIADSAFMYARLLKSINIPDSVVYIGEGAFRSDSLDEASKDRIRQINPEAIWS